MDGFKKLNVAAKKKNFVRVYLALSTINTVKLRRS